jgi:hypothetical protein
MKKPILVGEMWTLCGLVKGGFGDEPLSFLYGKLWRNGREECCMKEKQCK